VLVTEHRRVEPAVALPLPRAVVASPALIHPGIDAFFIGGASIAVYLFARLVPAVAASPVVVSFGLVAAWFVNWPHFAATNYRLYGSRAALRQYPFTAVVSIAFAVVLGVAAFVSKEAAAPTIVKLYLLWSPYHFCGQTIGLTLLYARRSGRAFSKVERYALMTFVYGMFVWPSSRAETGFGTNRFYGISYSSLGLPSFVAPLAKLVMIGGALTLAGALLGRRWRSSGFTRPEPLGLAPLVVVPTLAQFVWFIATPAGNFRYLVPLFHSVQYLTIAWVVQSRTGSSTQPDADGPELVAHTAPRRLGGRTLRWAAVNGTVGVLLFWLLPRLFVGPGGSLGFSTAVILAVVQIHHFVVDGVIWRISGPTRTALTGPTMFGQRRSVPDAARTELT
jgi:hypothetical protein